MGLGGLVVGFLMCFTPKGMRRMMFQLSGFYSKTLNPKPKTLNPKPSTVVLFVNSASE